MERGVLVGEEEGWSSAFQYQGRYLQIRKPVWTIEKIIGKAMDSHRG